MCAWFQKSSDSPLGKRKGSETTASSTAAGRRRRITLGLDFGTSTSKCCFREEGDGKPFVFADFAGPGGAGSSPLFDTAVAVRNRKLLFGPDATRAAEVIRSFKMCLPCQARREAGTPQTGKCPRCSEILPGTFEIAGTTVSAEDLCTLHLSVMLSEVLPRIPAAVGADASRLRVHVNAAAPLDQLREFGSVGPYFERVVYYAFRLAESGSPRRSWQVKDAIDALKTIHREPKPPESESPTALFPETHAAMTGFMLLPESEKGLYGLIDVGAGTSDISFFWLQKDENKTEVSYYATGTTPKGMDDVDRSLAPLLNEPHDRLRAKRESMGADWVSEHSGRFDDVGRAIDKHYKSVYGDARQLDQRAWAFKDRQGVAQFRLFLVGGGAGCEPLVERMCKAPPLCIRWSEQPSRLLVPADVSVISPSGVLNSLRGAGFESARPLLLLAYGLAHPRPDVPKYERDLEGVVVVKVERERITHEDLY